MNASITLVSMEALALRSVAAGRATAAEVGRDLHLTGRHTGVILRRLEKFGLVVGTYDEPKRYTLTTDGQAWCRPAEGP